MKSAFVCQRCGVAVALWRGEQWRHQGNMHSGKSCGKPPVVVSREAYDKMMADVVEGAKAALQHHNRQG